MAVMNSQSHPPPLFFSILLNLTFVSNSNTNDKYIIALGNQKPMKISAKLMFRGCSSTPEICLFALCLFLSIWPSSHSSAHPLIRSSVQLANPLPSAVVEWEAVSLNFNSEGYKDLTFFFFLPYLPEKQRRLYSLQLLSHLCPSSSSFLFSLWRSFQRPEDNGTPHDAIVLLLLSPTARRWRFKVLF